MTTPTDPDRPLATLYSRGERLGWTFRDRNLFRTRFPHPPPAPEPVPPALVQAATRARQKMTGRMMLAGGPFFAVALALACCGGVTGDDRAVLFSLAALLVVGGLASIGIVWANAGMKRSALAEAQARLAESHHAAVSAWEQARDAHDASERARVDVLDEWGAADPPPGARRIDIVGGNVWGWEAFLTVFGGSLLKTRGALTLVDFTGESACRELVRLASENDVSFDVRMLPDQLPQTNLFAGLRPRQVVDMLVEAMHGDATSGTRAERAQDDRILMAIVGALGGRLTPARIAAAARVLMGEGDESLSAAERQAVAGLFAADFIRETHANLRRIEAFTHPLQDMGTRADEASSATLTCLVDESEGGSARRELLKDVIVQWLIQRVSSDSLNTRSVVIAGADDIGHAHLERLTDLCERRDIRLVLLFRHLRGAAVTALGGGVVGFMRLANHEEAQRAADFIGREHRFVLSRLTRTLGGNDTHSAADTQGMQTRRGGQWTPGGRHRNWSVTRSWSQTHTVAEGTNWSDASMAERVYEHTVEPRTLQDLPDYALLVRRGAGAEPALQAVECNPEIITLPRVTMDPLPALELPGPDAAWLAVTASPTPASVLGVGRQTGPAQARADRGAD
jgi:hypothetical protein